MPQEIETEIKRVVGEAAVDVAVEPAKEVPNRRVRLETANAVYHLPENRLLILLEQLPDRIGVDALRQSIEQNFPSTQK